MDALQSHLQFVKKSIEVMVNMTVHQQLSCVHSSHTQICNRKKRGIPSNVPVYETVQVEYENLARFCGPYIQGKGHQSNHNAISSRCESPPGVLFYVLDSYSEGQNCSSVWYMFIVSLIT